MNRQLAGFRLLGDRLKPKLKPKSLLKNKVPRMPGRGQWLRGADKAQTLRKTQAFDWERKKSHPWG